MRDLLQMFGLGRDAISHALGGVDGPAGDAAAEHVDDDAVAVLGRPS